MQNRVKIFNEEKMKRNGAMPAGFRVLDIQSELGELAKEVLKSANYGENNFAVTDDFKLEFGDVLYSLLSLANETGISAEECLNLAMKKYESRLLKNNNIGSGR